MKVYICADLEGITGLTGSAEMAGDERARTLMAGDVNAAVAGAFDGGATAVVVCDAHASATTLRPEDVDPRAQLIRGRTKPGRMVEGLDGSFGALLCVGHHERAGGGDGVLNHTWAGQELMGITLAGEPAGELRLLAALAAEHGVPLALVTGDDRACAEARSFAPHVRTAPVKVAIDRFAARLEHPGVTRPRIRAAAAAAVREAPSMPASPLDPPVTIAAQWSSTAIAQQCALVPGAERPSPRATSFTAPDARTAYAVLIVWGVLAGHAQDPGGY